MSLDLKFFAQLRGTLTNASDLTTAGAPVDLAQQLNFVDGAGAGAANRIFLDTRTVTASGTDSLDLAGALTDPFGAALTFARIKGLFVVARATNVTDIRITRPASNAVPLFSAAGYIPVKPGGFFGWFDPSAAGVAVTAATADLLDMVNSGATDAIYNIAIIGAAS
ncbi:hypothetical protein [Herbidospora sp. RD11066]